MQVLSHIDEDKLKILCIVILSASLMSIMYFISEDMKNEILNFEKCSVTPGANTGESYPPICKMPDGTIYRATIQDTSHT